MAAFFINDLYLADCFLSQIQKTQNSQSDPDKFIFFSEKLAKVARKSAKFAKVILISANGQISFKKRSNKNEYDVCNIF
jgi:hypothetical protein